MKRMRRMGLLSLGGLSLLVVALAPAIAASDAAVTDRVILRIEGMT